jgi:hypothetical protein
MTRRLAAGLEGSVMAAADAITAVSARTYEEIFERRPELRTKPCAAIPIGAEPEDFRCAGEQTRRTHGYRDISARIDPRTGAVGTILPMGVEVVRALLAALAADSDSAVRRWPGEHACTSSARAINDPRAPRRGPRRWPMR